MIDFQGIASVHGAEETHHNLNQVRIAQIYNNGIYKRII
jgi:hypothetical protein